MAGVAGQLAVAFVEEVAREEHPRVVGKSGPQAVLIALLVGRVAYHDQPQVGLELAEGLEQDMGVVLGHEAAHEEEVAAFLQPEARQVPAGVGAVHVGAVGDELGARRRSGLGRCAAAPGVGDQTVGAALGVALGPAQVALRRTRPLGALRVEPVDVQDGGDAGSRDRAADGALPTMKQTAASGARQQRHVKGREQRVDERVEVLGGDRRQVHERHAPVRAVPRLDGVRAAVDGDVVALCGQASADVLTAVSKPL